MQLRSGYGLGLRGQDGQSKWTEEQVGHLAYAVRVVFARWTALTMAVENQWGGPDSQGKAQDLVRRVTEWLITTKGAMCARDRRKLEGLNTHVLLFRSRDAF